MKIKALHLCLWQYVKKTIIIGKARNTLKTGSCINYLPAVFKYDLCTCFEPLGQGWLAHGWLWRANGFSQICTKTKVQPGFC